MMQKNASNIVVKTVCELNIQVKNYDGKTSVKKKLFLFSLPPPGGGVHSGYTGRGAPGAGASNSYWKLWAPNSLTLYI